LFSFSSGRNWNDDERETLIEAMKSYPLFYDSNAREHKDGTLMANAKATLSQMFTNCSKYLNFI
jgi:hypothetical protein